MEPHRAEGRRIGDHQRPAPEGKGHGAPEGVFVASGGTSAIRRAGHPLISPRTTKEKRHEGREKASGAKTSHKASRRRYHQRLAPGGKERGASAGALVAGGGAPAIRRAGHPLISPRATREKRHEGRNKTSGARTSHKASRGRDHQRLALEGKGRGASAGALVAGGGAPVIRRAGHPLINPRATGDQNAMRARTGYQEPGRHIKRPSTRLAAAGPSDDGRPSTRRRHARH